MAQCEVCGSRFEIGASHSSPVGDVKTNVHAIFALCMGLGRPRESVPSSHARTRLAPAVAPRSSLLTD
jgi:hypothetical protein